MYMVYSEGPLFSKVDTSWATLLINPKALALLMALDMAFCFLAVKPVTSLCKIDPDWDIYDESKCGIT